jgi:hypothetical protein
VLVLLDSLGAKKQAPSSRSAFTAICLTQAQVKKNGANQN